MAEGGRTAFTWHGEAYILRADVACEFALEETAVQVAQEAKGLVPVVTGTLQRSYHTAPPGYSGGDEDFVRAAEGEDLLADGGITLGAFSRWGAAVEVGSWIPYACVEEQRTGALGTAMSLVSGAQSESNFVEALAEEGIFVEPI